MERVHIVSMGQPCQVWILERLIPYLGTLEPCVDMHRTVSYIAWSYWGQERSGGTEALQMFFISGPQGKSVTTTPGSFCSELGGRAVMLCHSLAIRLKIDSHCFNRVWDALFTWTVSCRHLYGNNPLCSEYIAQVWTHTHIRSHMNFLVCLHFKLHRFLWF